MKTIALVIYCVFFAGSAFAMGAYPSDPPGGTQTTPTSSSTSSSLPGPFGTWDQLTQSSANWAYGNISANQALQQQQQTLNNPLFDLMTWPLLP